MYIGFTTKLKHMSHFRIGAGVRMRGSKGWLLFCLFAILNLYWYMILGCLWMMYGCFLMFYLPIRAIVKTIKKRQIAKKNAMVA